MELYYHQLNQDWAIIMLFIMLKYKAVIYFYITKKKWLLKIDLL